MHNVYIEISRKAGRTIIEKDLAKIKRATKFVGRGVKGSSTHLYFNLFNDLGLANTHLYTDKDFVFISVNGKRKGSLSFDKSEVDKVVEAKAKIICDNTFHRNRDYNEGERNLYQYLSLRGYSVLEENKYYCILHKKEG